MNKFIGMGRLTKDPDVRYVDGKDGKMCVAKYNLAIDRYGSHASSEQSADFIRCTAFGKNGEFTEKYLKCGTKIVIEAHVQTGSFDDNNGNKVFTTEFVIEKQEFAEKRASAPGNTTENNVIETENVPFE